MMGPVRRCQGAPECMQGSGRSRSSTMDRHSGALMPENSIKVGSRGEFGKLLTGLPCTGVQAGSSSRAPGRNTQELKPSLDPDCDCKLSLPLSEGDAHTSFSLYAEVSNA